MLLTIQYFASIREAVKRNQEELELPVAATSVQGLIDHLLSVNPQFNAVFSERNKVLVAVNQTVVGRSHLLSANDEVAFFPPMTGG